MCQKCVLQVGIRGPANQAEAAFAYGFGAILSGNRWAARAAVDEVDAFEHQCQYLDSDKLQELVPHGWKIEHIGSGYCITEPEGLEMRGDTIAECLDRVVQLHCSEELLA